MKNIQLDAFIEYQYLNHLQASPERTAFAFLSSKADLEKNEYHQTLYVSKEGEIQKIRKLKTNHDFIFLNEDQLLIDLQKNKKERDNLKNHQSKSFYTYDLNQKSLDFAFTLPINGSVIELINDHELLVSATLSPDDHVLYQGDKKKRDAYIKNNKKESLYEDIHELPYYFNGQGFKTNLKKQLFVYDMNTNNLKRLLDPKFSVEDVILSRDKTRVYYTGRMNEDVLSRTSKIYQYDLMNETTSVVYNKEDFSIHHMVDMVQLVVFASDMKTYGMNQNPDVFVCADGEMRCINYYGFSFGNSMGTDCRLFGSKQYDLAFNQFYFVSTIDDHTEIKSLSKEGEINTYYQMDGSVDGLIHMHDHLVLIAMKGQFLQEVYRLNFDGSLEQLTTFNESYLKDVYVAKPQEMVCHKDGHDVKGFVLLPQNYDPNQKYPMIFDIHGGPKTVYGQIYYHEMQYWVNQGYIVAFSNPRGSDGKGNEFADIRGKYGTIDYEDLMDFVNQVVWEYKAIDQENMYVTGGSYGGFMTNWIVGHTDRFKAAVTQRSISNWLSFYGTSDIGYFFATDQTDGHPILDLEKIYEQSPIKYAMNVKTPLRFIHSDKDYRCPMEQAQQFYAVLKTKGLDTDLIWFKEETHELSRGGKPQARIKRLKDITEWFKNH